MILLGVSGEICCTLWLNSLQLYRTTYFMDYLSHVCGHLFQVPDNRVVSISKPRETTSVSLNFFKSVQRLNESTDIIVGQLL